MTHRTVHGIAWHETRFTPSGKPRHAIGYMFAGADEPGTPMRLVVTPEFIYCEEFGSGKLLAFEQRAVSMSEDDARLEAIRLGCESQEKKP